MDSGRSNQFARLCSIAKALPIARLLFCAPVLLLVGTLVSLPAQAEPELLPLPQESGKKQDPNQSENPTPIGPIPDAAPLELETNVAKLIRLNRADALFEDIVDREPVNGGATGKGEELAFNYIFRHAQKFTPEQSAQYSLKSSNPDGGLIHADLIEDIRKDFQRELIHVVGRLVRLRTMKPTEGLAEDYPVLYEGWLFNRNVADHPVSVVFAELPPGMVVGEILSYDVAVDGYYFKLLKYKSNEKIPARDGKPETKVERLAPLLIARTIRIIDDPTRSGLGDMLIPVAIGIFAGIGGVLIILVWWFHRDDTKVKQQTREALTRINPFQEPPPDPNFGKDRIAPPPSSN